MSPSDYSNEYKNICLLKKEIPKESKFNTSTQYSDKYKEIDELNELINDMKYKYEIE